MRRLLVTGGAVFVLGCLGCVVIPAILYSGPKQKADAERRAEAQRSIAAVEQWKAAHGTYPSAAVASSNGMVTPMWLEYAPSRDGSSFTMEFLEAGVGPFTADCYEVYSSTTGDWDYRC